MTDLTNRPPTRSTRPLTSFGNADRTSNAPWWGKIEGSIIGSMKELRPGSTGRSEVRILFVFDPERKAVLLVGGDKQNKWNKWYKTAIREAERRYIRWLEEQHGKDTK